MKILEKLFWGFKHFKEEYVYLLRVLYHYHHCISFVLGSCLFR